MDRDGHSRRRRRLGALAAGAAALIAGVGVLLLDGPGPEDVVQRYADTVRDGDCAGLTGTYSTDRPEQLPGPLDVCRRGGGDLVLEDFRVTEIDESPVDLAVPDGATEVARVGYQAETAAAGATTTYDGAFVVALFDGEWRIVDDDA